MELGNITINGTYISYEDYVKQSCYAPPSLSEFMQCMRERILRSHTAEEHNEG